jgi:hypothetical protein
MEGVDLSNDQKNLLDLCFAIKSGTVDESLARRKLGPLCHSRWLTLAVRVLRLYVSTVNPSQKLRILVEYIMFVYAPCWFDIKRDQNCCQGPMHFFTMLQRAKLHVPANKFHIIADVLQRNNYFCHPENLLLAMLISTDEIIRDFAIEKILKARDSVSKFEGQVRPYIKPQVNFEASNFTELIDWDKEEITEPPLCKGLNEDQLRNFIAPDFLCHTQGTERLIRLVTTASARVFGQEHRDRQVRGSLRSQQLNPSASLTKSGFNLNYDD